MEKNVCEFLDSDLNESEFYNILKGNLINLREYMLSLKDKDINFQKLALKPISSIMEKCDWVGDVGYYSLDFMPSSVRKFDSYINLLAKDGINLMAHLHDDSNTYAEDYNLPKLFLLKKENRVLVERYDDIRLIEDELREIEEVGHLVYGDTAIFNKSVSGNFNIEFIPNVGIVVWEGDGKEIVANFFKRDCTLPVKPYLNSRKKAKVLTKIQLEQKVK